MMEAVKQDDVLIIGAGLSGLACARALARRGVSARILEAHTRVAEPWRKRHPALRLNIHRHFACLPGRKPPTGDGVFLKRDSVISYLEDYASDIDVPIDFSTEVLSIKRCVFGWHVETRHTVYQAKNVVFATGRDRIPHIPDWRGKDTFKGTLLHARDIGDVAQFDGKRVLVAGAGNSGSDVLNHLARHNPAEVLVSVRYGPAVVPSHVFGFPLHRLARGFAMMPTAFVDWAFRLTQRLFLGDLAKLGLPSHPDGGGTRLMRDGIAFAIDDGFVDALKKGRFRAVANVRTFNGHDVILADGKRVRPDVVIAATGYRTGLQKLLSHLGAVSSDGQPFHPSGEADCHNPGLWFTGYRSGYTGYFDAARKSGDKIARAIHDDLSASHRVSVNQTARQSGPMARQTGI